MNKVLKGLVAVAATAAMAIAGVAGASSATASESGTATTSTITIKNTNVGDTFAAYRLLNATDGGNNKFAYTLNEKYTTSLQTVTGKTTQEDIVSHISTLDETGMRTFADSVYAQIKDKTADLNATAAGNTASMSGVYGYYLVAQTSLNNNKDSYSLVMVDSAGKNNVEITTKKGVPTLTKKVKDRNDTAGSESNWQDSADYDLKDKVPFQLTGTMPDKIANYTTYKYVFHDSLSKGLTLNADSITVYAQQGDNEAGRVQIDAGYSVAQTDGAPATERNDGTNFTVSFANVKAATANGADITVNADTKIIVEYSATLNANSKIGAEGNPNEAYLEFSNNPYAEGTGKTTNDKVKVFTFEIDVNKTFTGADAPTDDPAQFTLYKKVNNSYVPVGDPVVVKQVNGNWVAPFQRVDDGDYKLVESYVPQGFNKAADVEFTVSATHDETADDPTLTALTITINGDEAKPGDSGKGTVAVDVVNVAGSKLPSTGGMGTTILYAAGAAIVLVAAFGIAFAVRRRNAR